MLLRRISLFGVVMAGLALAVTTPSACGDATAPTTAAANASDGRPRTYDSGGSSLDAGSAAFASPSGTMPGFTEGWQRVAWAPECSLYEPIDDAGRALVSAPKWQGCESGRIGCERLSLDFSSSASAAIPIFSMGSSADGSSVVFMVRIYNGYQREFLLWDIDHERLVAVWRHDGPLNCVEVPTGSLLSDSFALAEAVFEDPSTVREYRLINGTMESVMAKATADWTFRPSDVGVSSAAFPHQLDSNGRLQAIEFPMLDAVLVRDSAAKTTKLLGGPTDAVHSISLWGPRVFENKITEVDTWTALQGEAALIKVSNVSAHDFVTDGTTMAWLQAGNPDSDGFFATATVEVSPFAEVQGDVHPQPLGPSACRFYDCASGLSNGYMITQAVASISDTSEGVLLTNLADGTLTKVDPIQNAKVHERLGTPGFVRQGEAWISLGEQPSLGMTIMRQSLKATVDGGE